MVPYPSEKVKNVVLVPVLGKVPAGIPQTITEDIIEDYITVPGAPPNCFALKVSGQSMEPTIRDGDYVLFVVDRDYQHGGVVVVNDEFGDPVIKRLKYKEEQPYLVSDNPKYETLIPNGNYKKVGVVVKVWRDVKF